MIRTDADSEPIQAAAEAPMIRIAGGAFWMGSDDHYPEEAPARRVALAPFLIDATPVTNAAFARFVEATGYVTFAERPLSAADYPDADPALLKPGSAVFTPPDHPVPLTNPLAWWSYVVGADWRHPEGPSSSLDGLEQHPAVHVTIEDAKAYASWAGKRLPSEAEWECAARGGLERTPYAWGDELEPEGQILANYWRGAFPSQKLPGERFRRTSPVGSFPANGFGLYDMIGNVWEWTSDRYDDQPRPEPSSPCCAPQDASAKLGRMVLKGGSHLCAENYCRRYRPAARYPQPIDTSTSHIGFRCAQSL